LAVVADSCLIVAKTYILAQFWRKLRKQPKFMSQQPDPKKLIDELKAARERYYDQLNSEIAKLRQRQPSAHDLLLGFAWLAAVLRADRDEQPHPTQPASDLAERVLEDMICQSADLFELRADRDEARDAWRKAQRLEQMQQPPGP
jgi:hypothetical protein